MTHAPVARSAGPVVASLQAQVLLEDIPDAYNRALLDWLRAAFA